MIGHYLWVRRSIYDALDGTNPYRDALIPMTNSVRKDWIDEMKRTPCFLCYRPRDPSFGDTMVVVVEPCWQLVGLRLSETNLNPKQHVSDSDHEAGTYRWSFGFVVGWKSGCLTLLMLD